MNFLLQTMIAVIKTVLAFYGFWFVWQVLLPILPGPNDRSKRIARFAFYFTGTIVKPLARVLHVNPPVFVRFVPVACDGRSGGIGSNIFRR